MKSTIQRIAVVSINRDKYSETFIQRAFDSFPCTKWLLYGGYLPTHVTEDWRKEGEAIPKAPTRFWERKPEDDAAAARRNLRRWLRKHRPDVVLANYGPSGVAVADLCAELKLPLVVHFHGYDAYRTDILDSYGRAYPELFARAQACIAVSEDMKTQLLRLGAAPAKLHTYIYGVDLGQFAFQPLPTTDFRFLFVGRFVPKKSPDLLVQAFAAVHRTFPQAKLTLVGDGELMPRCRELVVENGLSEAVTFRGAVSPAQVAQALADAHVLVLPSQRTPLGDAEGTPLVILEAAAIGRAVISTAHGGISAVVAHGETGVLVAEGSVMELVAAMQQLLEDPEMVARMGIKAHALAKAQFSDAIYHQKLWKTLELAASASQ